MSKVHCLDSDNLKISQKNRNPKSEEMVNPSQFNKLHDDHKQIPNDPWENQEVIKQDAEQENLIEPTEAQVKDIEMEQFLLPNTQRLNSAVKITHTIYPKELQGSSRKMIIEENKIKKLIYKQKDPDIDFILFQQKQRDFFSPMMKKSKIEKRKDLENDFKQRLKQPNAESSLSWWNRFKKDNLSIRKSWRIFILLFFVFIFILLTTLFYCSIGFIRGNENIQNNQKIKLSIESCILSIYDYSLLSTEQIDYNFLGTTQIPSSLDDSSNAYFNFIYPNSPGNSKSQFTKSEENGETTYTIFNQFSSQSCEAIIFLYKQTTFDSFQIDCGSTTQCSIIINSSLASFNDLNITGFDVQMNAPELTTNNFNFKSSKGHIEIPNFTFSTASIQTREGDIVVQSTKGIKLTTYQKDPFICLSSVGTITQLNTSTDYSDTSFKSQFTAASTDCKSVYPYGEAETDDTLIEKRCMKGEQQLNSNGSAPQVLYAENSFGNIFVNVISSKGSFPKEQSSINNVILYNKIRVGESTDLNVQSYINLSELSINNLANKTKTASNPNVYDPIFLYYFGPQYTRSDSSQQIQVIKTCSSLVFRNQWSNNTFFCLIIQSR